MCSLFTTFLLLHRREICPRQASRKDEGAWGRLLNGAFPALRFFIQLRARARALLAKAAPALYSFGFWLGAVLNPRRHGCKIAAKRELNYAMMHAVRTLDIFVNLCTHG